jgi:EAL domain-containing protein (putative c-di-GMP-specific phosphodiesterase class I)
MPVQALCTPDGLAEDNLDVLVDLGLSVVLYEFGTTSGDLACLEDLPIHSVKMSDRVVNRIADRADDEALFTRAMRDLVPLVRSNGNPVIVGDIETEEQFEWWRAVGADTVLGNFTGAPAPASSLNL